MSIKKCTSEADYCLMANLFIASWQEQYGACKHDVETTVKLWASAGQSVYIFVSGGEALGYVATKLEGLDVEVTDLFVAKPSRQKGIGRKLLEHALPAGVKAVLWVQEKNAVARQFYDRMGFSLLDETKADRNSKDELILLKMKRSPHS